MCNQAVCNWYAIFVYKSLNLFAVMIYYVLEHLSVARMLCLFLVLEHLQPDPSNSPHMSARTVRSLPGHEFATQPDPLYPAQTSWPFGTPQSRPICGADLGRPGRVPHVTDGRDPCGKPCGQQKVTGPHSCCCFGAPFVGPSPAIKLDDGAQA